MKQYLVEIEKQLSADKKNLVTYEGLPFETIMNNPATQDEIIRCKKLFSKKIPSEYITFLSQYNGGTLYKVEDFAGYKLFSISELLKENSFQRENFGDDWPDSILLFCSCLGDNEYIGFKFGENDYSIVHCIMDMLPDEWIVIEKSFDVFLSKLVMENGRKYWLND